MSEIRNKTIDELAEAMANAYFSLWEKLSEDDRNNWRYFVKNRILSNEHVAIVDRKAKFPTIPEEFQKKPCYSSVYGDGWYNGVKWLKKRIKLAGWVKEIKDETTN